MLQFPTSPTTSVASDVLSEASHVTASSTATQQPPRKVLGEKNTENERPTPGSFKAPTPKPPTHPGTSSTQKKDFRANNKVHLKL